jgi:hypothetical protein
MTSLLIVGLLVVPPVAGERPGPVFPAVTFSSLDRAERLKLDYRSAVGSFTAPEFTRTGAAVQGSARSAPQNRKPSTARKIVGAAVGAFGGFFLGGYAGAAIEGDRCNCDDPGLKGFLIGAPIGAVAGGLFGALIAK